jgi:hypothetical protein
MMSDTREVGLGVEPASFGSVIEVVVGRLCDELPMLGRAAS